MTNLNIIIELYKIQCLNATYEELSLIFKINSFNKITMYHIITRSVKLF